MYTSRAVILACGVSKAGYVPGEAEYLGRGVSYCATCDGMLYRQKRVAVWGLSPEAPEEAEFLHSIGCRVTYIAAKASSGAGAGHCIRFRRGDGRVRQRRRDGRGRKGRNAGDRRPVYPAPGRPAGCPRARHRHGERPRKNRRRHAHQHPRLYAAGDMLGAPLQVAKAVGEGLIAGLCAAEDIQNMERKANA